MSHTLPSEANFDHKNRNPGVYRTRVKYFSTNQNNYTPKSTIKIEVDSTKPASFIDGSQTRLDFTVVVYNNSPFVDYVNLPRCGWNSIFKEFRLIIGGTALENNKDYAYSMEQRMIKDNHNPDPVHIFHSNPWTPPEGPTQINFIKPSMVDCTGNYMYGRHTFCDKNPFNFMYFSKIGSYDSNNFNNEVIKGTPYSTVVGSHGVTYSQTDSVTDEFPTKYGGSSNIMYWPRGSTNALSDTQMAETIVTSTITNTSNTMPTDKTISAFGYFPPGVAHTFGSAHSIIGSGIAPQSNMRPASVAAGNGSVDTSVLRTTTGSLTQLGYIPNTQKSIAGHRSTYAPGCWPYGQPSEKISREITRNRNQDGATFYSNYKSIPVGLGASSFSSMDDYVFNNSKNLANYTEDYNFEFRCSTPIMSGLIGSLAEKWFPESLARGKKMWLEFDLIEARQAFSITMDPCRRVPTTVRDFVPFTGRPHNTDRLSSAKTTLHAGWSHLALQFPHVEDGGSGTQVETGTSTTLPGSIDTTLNTPITTSNESGRLGVLYMIAGATYNANAAQGIAGVPSLHIPSNARHLVKWAYSGTDTTTKNQPLEIPLPSTAVAGQTTTMDDYMRPGAIATNNALNSSVAVSVMSGLAMPQYVPVQKPWGNKGSFISSGAAITITNEASYFVNEAQVCFGTYLPASVPQTKRTTAASVVTNGTNLTGDVAYYKNYGAYTTTYSVTGVELVLELMTMSDELNRAIIERASSGSLSFDTKCIGTGYNNLPATDNQQVLLPVIGASIKHLLLSFRSSEAVYTDNAYLYNSYACFNPYAALTFTADADYHVGGTYSLTNYLTTQQNLGINMRLKIGSEEYPVNPINSVPEIVYEYEKGVSSIGNRKYILDYVPSYIPYRRDTTAPTTNQVLEYSCQESGYFSVFTPVDALDDQTITGNPFYNFLEYAEKLQIKGKRADFSSDTNGYSDAPSTITNRGVWNIFTPLDGCFQLAFHFDTFTDLPDCRSGLTIVNNQCFWLSNKVIFASHKVSGSSTSVLINCVWEMDCRIQFEAGGNIMAYF